jgi:hypothetical protein
MNYLFALFLAGHSLVHAFYLSPRPPDAGESWPFDMARSWLVTQVGIAPELLRTAGILLVAVTVLGFLGSPLLAAGIGPDNWWRPAIAIATVASTLLLAVFFHPWITIGLAIDGLVLWAVFAANWLPGANH